MYMSTKKSYQKLFWATCIIALFTMPKVIADDTEIYLSTNVDILDDAVRPNVMFVMDTSGSMGNFIAVQIPSADEGFAYDPNRDYGSSDENLIYVYNEDFEFQNTTHTYQQSVCNSMETFFDANPGFPIFSDRAVQWQSSTTTQTIEETELVCTNIEVDNADISLEESGRVDNNEWDYYGPYDVSPGTEFSVTAITDSVDRAIRLYVRIDDVPTSSRFDCRLQRIDIPAENCSVNIGNGDEQVYVAVRGRDRNTNYVLDITYGGSAEVEQCTEITTPVEIEVTEANWSDALETSNQNNAVLECFADSGDHGIDEDSNLTYVQNCGTNDCSAPLYSSQENQQINWASIETHSFLTANFHDFIQTFGAPEAGVGGLPVGDIGDYCNEDENEGTQFMDDDGVVYECVEKRMLMQSAANQLVASLTNMNLGLARLNGRDGGYVLEAIRDIEGTYSGGTTVRERYIDTINDLPAAGATPLAESLWEMTRYFQGNTRDFAPSGSNGTDPAALDGDNYISPISNSCQSNNVILLTDGIPNRDEDRNSEISQLTGNNCPIDGESSRSSAGSCLDELAEYAATHDISTGIDGVSGAQTLQTYTIGFDIDLPLLETTAQRGNGQYFTATNAFELTAAFNSIFIDILSDSSTFVAPAIAVNAFNQLQSRNEIYFAVFRPSNSPRWTGNVKKFTISSEGQILDANGLPAIDPSTGFFASTTQDLWSGTIDGNNVDAGGFRDRSPDDRRIFTFFGDSPSEVDLSSGNGAYQFNTSNAAITKSLLGLPDSASTSDRDQLILWGSGEDLFDDDGDGQTNDANRFIGDILHSRPLLVTYGGTEDNPNDILYAGSNVGFLHAIDGVSGEELWSFIPDDLIKNIRIFQEGDVSVPKAYGLDGEMSIWISESIEDSDLDIETVDGDFVNLYVGMRRGGNDYYALDVSNYNAGNLNGIYPILKWKINGGEGEYVDLGQSWSRMVKAVVDWDCNQSECNERDVLFFSGGYDTVHDDATTITTGDLGNAIYMVDANTGELLWSAGNNSDSRGQRVHSLGLTEMQNSIPGSPNLVDVDADGKTDVVFATDIVGNVFRFDLSDETTNASNFATGGQIFDLNNGGGFQRFYNQPDIVLTGERTGDSYFNLVFGSGYMARPRDTEQNDSIFVLFEDDVFSAPLNEAGEVEYESIGFDLLYSPRAGSAAPADRLVNAPHGYYIPFSGNGEKMIRPGLIFQNIITYTSYLPEGSTAVDSCSGGRLGGSRLYRIDLSTGTSVLTTNDSEDSDSGNNPEYIELRRPGIAPEGTIIFLEEGAVLCIATECASVDDSENRQIERLYWREEEANNDS